MKKLRRNGIALIMVFVAMIVLVMILSVVTRQIYAQRNMVQLRQRRLEADWATRAGVELAAARLLTKPSAFSEENGDLLSNTKVQIVVEQSAEGLFVVTVKTNIGNREEFSVTRTQAFRRSDKDGVIKLRAIEVQKMPK